MLLEHHTVPLPFDFSHDTFSRTLVVQFWLGNTVFNIVFSNLFHELCLLANHLPCSIETKPFWNTELLAKYASPAFCFMSIGYMVAKYESFAKICAHVFPSLDFTSAKRVSVNHSP